MNASDFIARARKALGRRIPYNQENRAFDPRTEYPPQAGLDCGTFVRWAAEPDLSVNQSSEPAWDTTSIVRDATHAQDFFERITFPEPGCLVVYPDYTAKADVTGVETRHDGHVAIVTETGVVENVPRPTRVIHCSSMIEGLRAALIPGANPDSIAETDARVFWKWKPIYARVKNITPDTAQTATP